MQENTQRTDDLRNHIWNELYEAKKSDYYLSGYLSYLRSKRKKINLYVIVISILGLILEKWIKNSSFVTLAGLVIVQLLKDIIPFLSIDEKLLDKLPEYRSLYVNKFELLNRLYFDFDCGNIGYDDAKNEYFNIREMNLRIEELDNSIHLPEKTKIHDKAVSQTGIYMSNFFNIKLSDC